MELESVISDLRLFCIDKQARVFQNWASLNGFESGGGHFPAAFFAPSGPAIPELTQRGKERKNHEVSDSIQNYDSDISHRIYAQLFWAFTRSTSGRPSTGRRLPWCQYRGG